MCFRFYQYSRLTSTLQLTKYCAKLHLLERGLLDAAYGVDDIHLITRRKKKRGKAKEDADGDVDESDDQKDTQTEDVTVETEEQFTRRISLYVAVHLARVGPDKRDDYKDTLVYQTRKEVLNEFLKASMLKSCQNNDCRS